MVFHVALGVTNIRHGLKATPIFGFLRTYRYRLYSVSLYYLESDTCGVVKGETHIVDRKSSRVEDSKEAGHPVISAVWGFSNDVSRPACQVPDHE